MENINIYRESLIERGFVGVTEIMRFIPCSYPFAKRLLMQCQKQAVKEGKTNPNKKVLIDRVLFNLGITEEQIRMRADEERRRNYEKKN